MPIISVQKVDVGWAYRLGPSPTRIVLISRADQRSNWPSNRLLRLNQKKKGVWGTINPNDPKARDYEDQVISLVKGQIENNTLIVLPEFAGSPAIEKRIHRELRKRKKRCIVIGGSYYRATYPTIHEQDGSDQLIECICPILIPTSKEVFYQRKFVPAPKEIPGFDQSDHHILVAFQNTGFGDFAVIICSDALDARSREYVAQLRGQIDFLIVPARNHAPQLQRDLQTISDEERWNVAYCNGEGAHPSSILSPYSGGSAKQPTLADGVGTVDLQQFQHDLVSHGLVGGSPLFHTSARQHPFRPTARHWPYRGQVAINFARHLKVLAVGSHFDDVWLGCSGTLMRLRECYDAQVAIVTLCTQYPNDYYGRYRLNGAALDALKTTRKASALL